MDFDHGPRSDTCVCGAALWHAFVDERVIWCRRCGCVRLVFEGKWHVPLDRAGELSAVDQRTSAAHDATDDLPTRPGTPNAKLPRSGA